MRKLVFILGLLTICAGTALGQTLVVGQSGLPSTLDTGQDTNSVTPSYQVLDNLVGMDVATGELTPGLATDWQANEDSTVWTFSLREGVSFQDGTPFDAEAVLFNINRWNDPEFEYGFRDEGKTFVPWTWAFGGFAGSDSALLESIRAVDDHTVEFTLTESISFLPAILASSYLGIHSPEAIREAGPDYGTPGAGIVGTGPFSFVAWDEGSSVTLERNDDYWGDPAEVDQLVFMGAEDPTVRLAQLEAGSLDIALDLSSDNLDSVENSSQIEPAIADYGLNVGYVAFHLDHEPFDDVRVRRAVAHAIDRQAIVEAFYAGLGVTADQFVPEPLWGRADLDETYPYDPERAQELLAEAGYPDGFDTELWYMPVSRPYFPAPQPIAEVMATYLADVGINAELLTEDWGTYLEDYQGEFPMYMLGWIAEFPDPDNFLYTFFGPVAEAALGWDNSEAMALLEQGRETSEQSERAEAYQELGNHVNEEMVQLPVAHNRVLNATRTNVENFVPAPFGTNVFKDVSKAE